jgi:hypothetical protein
MARESELLFEQLVWTEEAPYAAALRAPYSFMNDRLAAFYGVSGPTGDAFERVPLDGVRRLGFLTHAGVLAAHARDLDSHPIRRGKFVRTQLLCTVPQPPPPGFNITPPNEDASKTTRERFAEHRADPKCAGCHELMDPIGLGFEHYDQVGRWRDSENGLAIDATGEVKSSDLEPPTFDGAVELTTRLAESAQAQACFALQWFRFAYGRDATADDACSLDLLSAVAANYSMKELIVALTQTDAFLHLEEAR